MCACVRANGKTPDLAGWNGWNGMLASGAAPSSAVGRLRVYEGRLRTALQSSGRPIRASAAACRRRGLWNEVQGDGGCWLLIALVVQDVLHQLLLHFRVSTGHSRSPSTPGAFSSQRSPCRLLTDGHALTPATRDDDAYHQS